jgi:hypothetical protein
MSLVALGAEMIPMARLAQGEQEDGAGEEIIWTFRMTRKRRKLFESLLC